VFSVPCVVERSCHLHRLQLNLKKKLQLAVSYFCWSVPTSWKLWTDEQAVAGLLLPFDLKGSNLSTFVKKNTEHYMRNA
jgi:hypothetical protein